MGANLTLQVNFVELSYTLSLLSKNVEKCISE